MYKIYRECALVRKRERTQHHSLEKEKNWPTKTLFQKRKYIFEFPLLGSGFFQAYIWSFELGQYAFPTMSVTLDKSYIKLIKSKSYIKQELEMDQDLC